MMRQPILVSIVALLIGAVQPCRAELVGHWTFNEGSGTTAHDSAEGHDGTIYGAGWIPGGALRFDGVDDYVRVPDAPSLDLTGFTLDVRFQINALPSIGQNWTILAKGEDPSTDHANYYLAVLNSNAWGPAAPKIACVFEDYSDYNHWLLSDIDESYVGRPVRVTSTLDGDAWNMYLDGSRVAATSYWNDWDPPWPLSGRVPATGTSPLFFTTFAAPSVGMFPGIIDDVRIYNHALTEAEIVPLPGAVLLGVLGLSAAGWRLRRGTC